MECVLAIHFEWLIDKSTINLHGRGYHRGIDQIRLFIFNGIFGPEPLVPASLEGVNFCVSLIHKLLCRPGTSTFICSGAIENNCLVLGIFLSPGTKL